MRRGATAGGWMFVGAAILLGGGCKRYVPDAGQETQRQIVDLTQRLEQRLVLGKCLPSTMDAWMFEDPSVRIYAKDAWGGVFVIRADGDNATIVSAGVDGVLGSDDDVEGESVVAPRGVPWCSSREGEPEK